MNVWRLQLYAAALVLSAAALVGCVQTATIELNPKALDFGNSTVANFRITNPGGGTLVWTLEEVTRASADAPWVASDLPWLSASPEMGETTTEIDRVALTAASAQLPVGALTNFGVRVNSAAGASAVLPLSITIEPTLSVNPSEISLDEATRTAAFSVINSGTNVATWEVLYLTNPDDTTTATALPGDFVVDPNPGSTQAGSSTGVNVTWTQNRTDFSLLVRSDAGDNVVSFRFGAALEGLLITPGTLRLFVEETEYEGEDDVPEQASSTLRIANVSAVSRAWQIELRALSSSADTPPISASPSSGTTPAGTEDEILVRVSDPTEIETGAGFYELLVRSDDSFTVIPIVVELQSLPEITLSEPPDPDVARPEPVELQTLDFGREEIQSEFYVVNTGPRNSNLYFRISHDDQGVENPVIADVTPLEGNTTGPENIFFWPSGENTRVDAEQILVTVDRTNLVEDVEFRTITVEAVDPDFLGIIDAVEVATIQVRVERQPLKVEGALNRSRPPFLLRFVFMLRDSLGNVIPTMTDEDLAKLDFEIFEDQVALNLNETNFFIDGPSDLKTNLVLMLDYTGSLLNAGTDQTPDPLAKGEAIELVKQAALKFIDDLPDSYRLQLMYHNDRQQQDRIIHTFSTDKGSLTAALEEFSLPFASSGVTNIFDAVQDAIGDLAAQDSNEVLPFDDADVRAVVFISDGRDNSSVATLAEVIASALESKVRLYPMVYSAGSDRSLADMIQLAEDTGGHLYNARETIDLTTLLGTEPGLNLDQATLTGANLAFFNVGNSSGTTLTWSIAPEDGVDWVKAITPSQGVSSPDSSRTITVEIDPTTLVANDQVEGKFLISSNIGDAEATIRYDVSAAAPLTAQNITVELDDPFGTVWSELSNQVVLTYVTPSQAGSPYNIRVTYEESEDEFVSGFFEEDAVFFPGTVIAGQIAMNTSGIFEDPNEADPNAAVRAEVFVRSDYVPRNTTRFRFRFFLDSPLGTPAAAIDALENEVEMQVEIAEGGLLDPQDAFAPTWRLIEEGDGIYVMITEAENDLLYGSFGNLLKITITGLQNYRDIMTAASIVPEFYVEMRADNDIYFSPAAPGSPSETKYFLYPGGLTNKGKVLTVSDTPDIAPPARIASQLAFPSLNPDDADPVLLDPEDPFAFDRDEDGLRDFNDPFPDDEDLPGTIVSPNPFEIAASVNQFNLTIVNNRLDTFVWSIDPLNYPSFVTDVVAAGGGAFDFDLAPDESEVITVTVDRGVLTDGFYRESLVIETDVFGDEEVELALVVAAP